MGLRDTEGVGAALDFVAGVDAGTASVAGEADLIVSTEEIVLASCRLTSFAKVGRIALESQNARAGTVVANGVGAAHDGGARRVGAGSGVLQTRLRADGNRHAHLEGVADEAFLATAVEASGSVEADCIHAARAADALVDIDALDIRVTLVADGAHAVDAVHALAALGAGAAPGGGAVGLLVLLGGARRVRVPAVAGVADAPVGLAVLAVGVGATSGRAQGRRHRCGEEVR